MAVEVTTESVGDPRKFKPLVKRAKMARERQFLGEGMWRDANLMGQRWQVETTLSSLKGTFGEYVMAKDWHNIVHEVKLKCTFLNLLLSP